MTLARVKDAQENLFGFIADASVLQEFFCKIVTLVTVYDRVT